jgi:predicted RNase H-like HicB family nuclease
MQLNYRLGFTCIGCRERISVKRAKGSSFKGKKGQSVEAARLNLKEAIELFFESASPEEIRERLHDEIFITRLEIAVA